MEDSPKDLERKRLLACVLGNYYREACGALEEHLAEVANLRSRITRFRVRLRLSVARNGSMGLKDAVREAEIADLEGHLEFLEICTSGYEWSVRDASRGIREHFPEMDLTLLGQRPGVREL